MPVYEIAIEEIQRLVAGPRSAAGQFEPQFEQRLVEGYNQWLFVCTPLSRLNGMARTINQECIRLQATWRFQSKYPSIEIPGVVLLTKAIGQNPVPLEGLIRIDDAISAICAQGKREVRDSLRAIFPGGALPDGSIRFAA